MTPADHDGSQCMSGSACRRVQRGAEGLRARATLDKLQRLAGTALGMISQRLFDFRLSGLALVQQGVGAADKQRQIVGQPIPSPTARLSSAPDCSARATGAGRPASCPHMLRRAAGAPAHGAGTRLFCHSLRAGVGASAAPRSEAQARKWVRKRRQRLCRAEHQGRPGTTGHRRSPATADLSRMTGF